MNLTNAHLTDALIAWLTNHGASLLSAVPAARSTLLAVRDANLRLGRELAADVRISVLTKLPSTHPVAQVWRDRTAGETAVTAAAIAGGWADFDRLDEAALLLWWSRSGFWDSALGATLTEHPVTDAQRAAVLEADANAQRQAAKVRRTITYAGGDFVVGETSFSSVADQITDALSGNTILLATGKAPRLKPAPNLITRPPGSGSGGRGGSNDWRGTDEQRDLTGFCGEVIAFEWLKRRFGGRRVVDETAWKSAYRQRVFGGQGDDGLGYDFHLNTGNVDWYFEVKATTGDGLRQPEMVELGSTEINWAETCKGDRTSHYRVLYIANALYPAKARLAVLPNPRTAAGKSFYAELTSGSRLWFNP
ncbi:MAG: DUF3883 domain-containing protein [Pseudomonadota bacterium]|nr:DUF3883 domain-containing protein [Pseudomonadota bacterium]